MWKDGARLALQHPLFGVGMDSVQNHWPEWNLQGFARFHAFWNFHSDIVQLAAERGLLTLAAWLWFVVAYLVYLLRLLPRLRQRTRFGWAVVTGILTGFVAFLLTSLVESSLGDDTPRHAAVLLLRRRHRHGANAEASVAPSTWREVSALAFGFWL